MAFRGAGRFRSDRAFTILEILMVTVLIAILVVVAVPLLRRSQMAGNEVAAMKALRTIHQSEMQHKLMYAEYATLADLGPAKKNFLIDPALASGVRSGYLFTLLLDPSLPSTWSCVATPQTYGTTGLRTFYMDETNVLRGSDLGKSEATPRATAETWPEAQ